MEVAVFPVRNQVLQQSLTVNRSAAILNRDTGPVRLSGNRTIGFQQMTVERFTNHLAGSNQALWGGTIVGDFNIQFIKALPFKLSD